MHLIQISDLNERTGRNLHLLRHAFFVRSSNYYSHSDNYTTIINILYLAHAVRISAHKNKDVNDCTMQINAVN